MAPANIVWCERVGAAYAFTPYVAELFNTASNASFFVAALVGLRRIASNSSLRRTDFICVELVLIVVGVGSTLFHAYPCRLTEVMDELPMSILACMYLACCRPILPRVFASELVRKMLIPSVAVMVVGSWAAYFYFHNFEIFAALFTAQVLLPSFISCTAGSSSPRGRGLYVVSTAAVLAGKAIWEWEQGLYRTGMCPQLLPLSSAPWRGLTLLDTAALFIAHPCWHLLSALSHALWMKYIAFLVLEVEQPPAKKYGEANADKKETGAGDVTYEKSATPRRRSSRIAVTYED